MKCVKVTLFLLGISSSAWAATPVEEITKALTREALKNPEVASAVREAAAAKPPMIEIGAARTAERRLPGREDLHFGVDLRAGAPLGAGIELSYTVVAPLTFSAAVDTTGATVAVTAEATLNILPIFMNARWTPTVSVAFSHIRFTGVSDNLWREFGPRFTADGVDITLDGMWMNAISVMGGIDYVGPNGFHFQLAAGRLFQVGESGGRTDRDGVVLRGWQSLVVNTGVGYVF